ncbi:hypothetical protein GGS26DRAFT_553076 [Hypomontagnella submonticulosa]|nr:hypothetical protein GGS26DRAFT_553076 [Hypomontagnella submonticulosa]
MAVKAVNDTAGPDGLVPTLLVFGAYPRLVETSQSILNTPHILYPTILCKPLLTIWLPCPSNK